MPYVLRTVPTTVAMRNGVNYGLLMVGRVAPDDLLEMYYWAHEAFGLDMFNYKMSNEITFGFTRHEDLIHFRLRWG